MIFAVPHYELPQTVSQTDRSDYFYSPWHSALVNVLQAPRGVAARAADRPLWNPGSPAPEWLDGSLPGDYGFDPLGLGSDPEVLTYFQQAELVHARCVDLTHLKMSLSTCL